MKINYKKEETGQEMNKIQEGITRARRKRNDKKQIRNPGRERTNKEEKGK